MDKILWSNAALLSSGNALLLLETAAGIMLLTLLIISWQYSKLRKKYRQLQYENNFHSNRLDEQEEIIKSMTRIGKMSYFVGVQNNPILGNKSSPDVDLKMAFSYINNMHPNDREHFINNCQQVFSGQKDSFDEHYTLQINGKRRLHLDRGKLFTNQRTGEKKLILVSMDITELEEQNSHIAYAESIVAAIFDNLPGPIFLKSVSSDFAYERCNPAYSGLLQKNPADLIGKNDFDLFDHKLAVQIRNCDLGVVRTRNIADNRWFFVTPDGKEQAIRFISRLLKHADGSESLLGFGVDVTRQEQIASKLRRRNKELRLLLSQQPVGSMLLDADLNLVCSTAAMQKYAALNSNLSNPSCREFCACNITDKAECPAQQALHQLCRTSCSKAKLHEGYELLITPIIDEAGSVNYLSVTLAEKNSSSSGEKTENDAE